MHSTSWNPSVIPRSFGPVWFALTWWRDPWHRWHCVHSLANFTWVSEVNITYGVVIVSWRVTFHEIKNKNDKLVLVFGRAHWFWDGNYRRRRQLLRDEYDFVQYQGRKRYAPLTLLFARSGVLHPKHVTVFTANFMSPPTVGVAIWMVLVCSPDTITTKLNTIHTSRKTMNVAHVKSWLSPLKSAQRCALVALRVGFPSSTLYRSGYYFPGHR